MNPEEKQKFKDHIQSEIDETQSALTALRELAKPVSPDNALGRLTRMEEMQTQKLNEATLHKTEAKLAALQNNLEHIDSPDFGKCERCGNPIQAARLLVMPESPLCVRCAS